MLVHETPKPGKACAKAVAGHFLDHSSERPNKPAVVWSPRARSHLALSSAPPAARSDRARLLVIGDRVTTDVILAKRIAGLKLSDAKLDTVSVLTTRLLAREGLGTTFMRLMEKAALAGYEWRKRRRRVIETAPHADSIDWNDCVIYSAEAQEVQPRRLRGHSIVQPISDAEEQQHKRSLADRLLRPSLPKLSTGAITRSIASLQAPLQRLIDIWTKPTSLATDTPPASAPSSIKSPASQWRSMFARPVDAADKIIERSEGTLHSLRRRIGT